MSDVETGDVAFDNGQNGYTETTYESYVSKLKNACTGVLIGFLLFFGSIGVLIWNEARAVQRQKDLDEGSSLIVEVDMTAFQTTTVSNTTNFENKLIHIIGPVTTTSTLVDPIFGVSSGNTTSTAFLKLQRSVEMYQWKERSESRKVKTANGGTRTTTTYYYDRVWYSYLIDSERFRQDARTRNRNPTAFPFEPLSLVADPILLGDNITLSTRVISNINWYTNVNEVSEQDIVDDEIQQQVEPYSNNGYYYSSGGGTNSAPVIGDTRITFQAVPPDTISIIAHYRSDKTLYPFTTSRGGNLLLVRRGTYSAAELFQQAEDENKQLTWFIRVIGFIVMYVSVLLILQPIATAMDIIPFLGDYMQGGLEKCIFPIVAFLVAFPISCVVISIAWLAYRPAIAVPVLIVSLGISIYMIKRARDKKHKLEEEQQAQQQLQQTQAQGGGAVVYSSGGGVYSNGSTTANQTSNGAYNSTPSKPSSSTPFSQALDNPPPTAPVKVEATPVKVDAEPEINTAEPEINMNEPYVPAPYKPNY